MSSPTKQHYVPKSYLKNFCYNSNGNIIEQGWYKNHKKNGYWHSYSRKGISTEKGFFKEGKKNNWWLFFNKIGELTHKCEFKKGQKDGYCIHYKDNEIIKGELFRKGIRQKEWKDWNSYKKDQQ